MKSPRFHVLSLGVTALAVLAAAGCGSSSSTPSSGATGSTSATQTLNVGQISNSVAYFPLYVAQQEGYFTAEHLNVPKPPLLGTGAKVAAALIGGSISVGAGVMTDAFNLYNSGQHPELIADLVNAYYVDIVVGKNFAGPGASAPLDQRIRALKGKKIGITGPGSGTQALVDYLFHLAGLNASTQATLVNLGSSNSAAISALQDHEVDALSFFQPVGQLAQATGAGHIYISPASGDVPALAGASNGTIYTTAGQLAANKSAIESFVRAIGKAENFIHSASPATLSSMLMAYDSGMSSSVANSVVSLLKSEIPVDPEFNQNGYQAEVTVNVQGGLVSQAPSYGQLVDSSLISSALG